MPLEDDSTKSPLKAESLRQSEYVHGRNCAFSRTDLMSSSDEGVQNMEV